MSPLLSHTVTVELSFSSDAIVVGGFTHGTCFFSTTAAGQTVSSVAWTHNGAGLRSGDRITITTPDLSLGLAEGESRLDIDSAAESDAGDYTCMVEFSNPSQSRPADVVQVTVASKSVTAVANCKLIATYVSSETWLLI